MNTVAWDLSAQPTPLDASFARLESIVSPLTGLVRRYWEVLAEPDDARIVQYVCQTVKTEHLIGEHVEEFNGAAGYDARSAIAATLGEAVERYCGAAVDARRIVFGSARELGEAAVGPDQFRLFDESQYGNAAFPFSRFDLDTNVRWIPVIRLRDAQRMYAPLQLVQLLHDVAPEETAVGYATSSGMACGATWEEALLSGAFELVERDAFMITWSNRLSLPLLQWDGEAAMERAEALSFAPARVHYSVVDLSAFHGIPTALCLVRDGGALAALSVGAASAPTIERAWRKAIAEAFQTRSWARRERRRNPNRSFAADHDDIRTFSDHVQFYARSENIEHAAFLDASAERRHVRDVQPLPGSTPAARLHEVLLRAEACGATLYAADLTTPDVRDAGLHVAKVFSPQLAALDASHRRRFLGVPRLREAPVARGMLDRALAVAELNSAPHPFP